MLDKSPIFYADGAYDVIWENTEESASGNRGLIKSLKFSSSPLCYFLTFSMTVEHCELPIFYDDSNPSFALFSVRINVLLFLLSLS